MTRIPGILSVSFAACALAATQSSAQDSTDMANWERCYGIALAGENDGLASGPMEMVPGSSERDYQGDAWVLVPSGECETIETPEGTGSLTPLGE